MKNVKVKAIVPSSCPDADHSKDCTTCPHFCGVGVSQLTDEVCVICGFRAAQKGVEE